MSVWRTEDYLDALREEGPMTDHELAQRMSVTTDEVWLALHGSLHRGEIGMRRGPGRQRVIGIAEAGVARVATVDLELAVLDTLDGFGPRSPLDLSEDLRAGREIHEILALLTFGQWITDYDETAPDHDVAITDRGRRRLDAAAARGSFESEWR